QDTLLCEHCGKNRVMITRYSEGYGTEECVLSDPQGESDADADIEDTDCLQDPGSLQRISSRRRKRPRVARQDTTESEDDGGRSHRTHRWNLRLSPDRAHSRTILEESISQVRPLVICQPNAERQKSPTELPRGSKLMSLWPTSVSLPLLLLLSLPLSLSLVIVIVSFLLPWAST
uniref:Si:ch211-63p21.1 n=1 Tax=Amphiprion percula TaxID=161767 RepID=A0A3P8RPI9_AMPPE